MNFRLFAIVFLTAMLAVSLAPQGHCENPAKPTTEKTTENSDQISQLIEQLGSTSYAEREQAETKLLEFHMEAFEPLIKARTHKDPEIAARARYLVRKIQVNLVTPNDSPKVAALMQNIFSLDRQNQESHIAKLAMLPNGEGLPALCRLIRFSESETSAKSAAVGIIQSRLYNEKEAAKMEASISSGYPGRAYSITATQRLNLLQPYKTLSSEEETLGKPLGQKERDEVRRLLNSCHRPAVEFVFAWFNFADAKTDAEKKAAYNKWDKVCQQEENLLNSNPAVVAPAIFSFLLKMQMDKAVELKLSEETQIDLVRRQLKRTHFWNRAQYKEIIDRLIAEKVWKPADISLSEFGTVMTQAYNQDILPRFFCLLIRENKNDAEKKKLGNELFELYEKSFQSTGTAKAAFHFQIMMVLIEEGLYDLAIEQHESAIKVENLPQTKAPERLLCWHSFQAVIDMQEGLEQFDLAAKTADEMLKRLESLNEKQKERNEVESLIKKTKSHCAYYRAMVEKKKGNEAAYRDLLEKALNLDCESGRTLIECYNLPVTPKTKAFHDQIVTQIQKTVATLTQEAKAGRDREVRANWAAWLVANTEGDLDSVIDLLESVSSRYASENSGILDTLALCYSKKGDLEKAISLQRQAVELAPYDTRLLKAWETLAQAYEKKTGKKPEPPKTGTARFRMMLGLPAKKPGAASET